MSARFVAILLSLVFGIGSHAGHSQGGKHFLIHGTHLTALTFEDFYASPGRDAVKATHSNWWPQPMTVDGTLVRFCVRVENRPDNGGTRWFYVRDDYVATSVVTSHTAATDHLQCSTLEHDFHAGDYFGVFSEETGVESGTAVGYISMSAWFRKR